MKERRKEGEKEREVISPDKDVDPMSLWLFSWTYAIILSSNIIFFLLS